MAARGVDAARMAIAWLALFAGPAAGAEMPRPHTKVRIENALKACVLVTPAASAQLDALLYLRLAVKVERPLADCGCKSAQAKFRTLVGAGGYEKILIEGVVPLVADGRLALPLAVGPGMVRGRELRLELACAPPD